MTTQESFICVLCKESFEDKETLQIHFRKHSDPAFNNQPKKSSPTQSEESKKSDGKVDLVSCDVCPEVFPSISKAITHKHKVHPEHDAKYFCYWCGKLFTLMYLFNKHLTSHAETTLGDEKFRCDCCDVDFYVPSAMLYHNKFFHRQDTDLPLVGHSKKQKFVNKELVQLYYCAFCGEEYINKVNLHKHMRDEHGDEEQTPEQILRCPLCEAVFHHLDAYEVHLTFHDSDDIYNGIGDDMRKEDISEFTLDTVPPIMEKVENAEPEEGEKDIGLDELLQLAMNEDSNVSGKKKHKKHKKHKKSKKETITLDEFLNMNTEVFGDGLDFQVHGVEEVPTKVVKRLSVKNKPQKILKATSKVVATPELERLQKQGIVIKNVNKPRLAPGLKIKGSPPIGSLKVANNVSTKATVTMKNPQNSQTSVKPSNEEVLSKLLSQSQNQIVISKKIQNSNQASTGSPTVNVFGSGEATPEDIEVQCDVRMTSSSELGEDDKIDPSKCKPMLEHSATNDNEASENNDSTTPFIAPESLASKIKEIKTKPDTDDEFEDNEADNITKKEVKPEVNSNVNILKSISQHITIKSLSQPKPASPLNSSPKRVETSKTPEVCKPAENSGQTDPSSQEAVNGSPKKAPLDVLKNLGHLTIKSSQKPSSPTVSDFKDKEESIVNQTDNKKTQESDKAKTEPNKSIEVLKKISPNITVKQAAHKQSSESDDSDVDKHFDFDNELDEHESDHPSDHEIDAPDRKPLDMPVNANASKTPAALKSIGQAITIKQTNPTKSNGKDAQSNTPPPLQQKLSESNDAIKKLSSQLTVKSINRPPVNRVLPKKQTTNDDEIVSVDDSDSDDIESKAKTHIYKSTPANALKSIPPQKVGQTGQNAPPRPVIKKPPQNIIVKRESIVTEDYPGTENDEFDAEVDIKPNVITKPVISNVAQKLLNNKNISLKNMNTVKKPQTPNRINSPQNSPNNHTTNPVVETQIVKYKPKEHVSDYDSDGGDFPDDFSNHSNEELGGDPGNSQPIMGIENDINKNMKEFNFDSDEHHFSDDHDDMTCGSNSQSIIDKLRNINQNLSIKSSNQNQKVVASTSSYQSISKNVTIKSANDNKRQFIQKQVNCLKRESSQFSNENDDDDENAVATPSKHHKVAEQSRELNKQTSMPVQRAAGRPGPASRQLSQAANTVNQQVTTSVKTIQSETVVEEITTTVTRTIKTINREVSMSGNQTISKVNVAPNIVQGARPRLSPSLQGVAVRQAAPGPARPRMRPTRPVVNASARVPNQVISARPSINQIRPATPRMPMKVRTVTPNQQTRPIKIAQNVQQALTQVNRAPTMDSPGHFSCFKKPKESLIPMDSSDDEFTPEMQAHSSLQAPKMNKAGSSKSMQSQSVVEMASSHQQISKLSTVSGLKIVKSSCQSKQVVNKVEVSGSNRTLEAIQRLQKQGLLVKKPRLEEPDNAGGGGLVAIEDAPH